MKTTKVTINGLHGDNEYIIYDCEIVVNNDTRGVMFMGYSKPSNDKRFQFSKYLPYQLIKRVEIEDQAGGMIVCNNPAMLVLAIDVSESVFEMEVIEQ